MTGLILASKSKARQEMLQKAGIEFKAIPADLDEQELIQTLQKNHEPFTNIVRKLAQQKALAVSEKNPESLVIGSDQILVFQNNLLGKAADETAAIERLKAMSGKPHILISAVAVARNNQIIWEMHDQVTLSMRILSADFLDSYAKKAKEALMTSVGGYWIEDIGIRLFERIEGDYFTILGMPLLPLLNFLSNQKGREML
jgi:septum formation protein